MFVCPQSTAQNFENWKKVFQCSKDTNCNFEILTLSQQFSPSFLVIHFVNYV